MKRSNCAICGSGAPRKLLYKQSFAVDDLTEKVFSARRLPDGLHYQIYKCLRCGLVFSDPVLEEYEINKLYKDSRFTYKDNVADLTRTYGYYLDSLKKFRVRKNRLLEIGSGNGFFLREAKRQGYDEVWGVEPSLDAINKTSKDLRRNLKNDVYGRRLFPGNFFDVICFFQVFDHVLGPNEFLENCRYHLKPGGLILAFNHNVDYILARLLGNKFPIFDVEHTFLYSPKTMSKIFKKHGFEVLQSSQAFNYYPIGYLAKMFPFPGFVGKIMFFLVNNLGLSEMRLKMKIGNLVLISRKEK